MLVAKPDVARAPSPVQQGRGGLTTPYTHGFATASIDIGENGGICEQLRLVNNHKVADEISTYFHVTTHACSGVGRMPLPLGVMRAET